jgi:hypothetical protein
LKKNTKVGIVFWVKFRQMTIIFLQIGEILVLFEFFSCQISKEIEFLLKQRQILFYAPAGSQK